MCAGVEAWSNWGGGSRSKGEGCKGTPWTPDLQVQRVARQGGGRGKRSVSGHYENDLQGKLCLLRTEVASKAIVLRRSESMLLPCYCTRAGRPSC
jgi:hypothetical protein